MEGNSSDEELSVIKKRKPYTITKQREKWTQEEHTRFLEALKLYGRAWQRIEEHIGTKTAVQIRSHAQKFFTKLEKEAVEKGIAPGQVHDIDIPPPRPKRKSSSPYPRKSSTGTRTSEEAMSRKPEKSMPLLGENQVIDTKSDSSGEKLMATKKLSRTRISEDAYCLEVTAFKDAKSNSLSSLNKISSSHSEFIEFLPTKETMAEKIATDKSSAPLEDSKSYIEQETEGHQIKFLQQQNNLGLEDEGKTTKLEGLTIQDSSKGNQTLANKSTMHVSNGGHSMQNDASDSLNPILLTSQVSDEAKGSQVSTIPVQDASTISYFHHPHTASVPLTHLHNDQDVYRSFLNSSTLPSLIVSTLLQNPAVHAAANLAASVCPSTLLHSTPYIQEVHNAHMNPTPSLEALAAATVAAAAAWWATQGLLPCFPPLSGFAFAPPKRNVPNTGIAPLPVHVTADENFPKEMQQIEDQNKSEVIKPQHASSKSKSSSSSGSDDCYGRDENSKELKDTGSSKIKSLTAHRSSDLDKARNQKKVDRSSCGSNTASSSEVEAYTMEKKHEKVNDEGKKDHDNFSKCGFNNYRLRSSGSLNESLKVSSEGRLAFQALFDRGVLPQSFSPPHTEKATTLRKKEASESKINHKKNVCFSTNLNQQGDKSKEEMYIAHEKPKVHQSGFKPYRRCSVAAGSNAVAEGTGNKRIRLQGEASS